ncbi:hypothetical protein GBA52_016000, partial [Prunus armeniaca]
VWKIGLLCGWTLSHSHWKIGTDPSLWLHSNGSFGWISSQGFRCWRSWRWMCARTCESGLALEVLVSKCPRLRALKLEQFHGICFAIGSELDDIALCSGLESLWIKNSADLTDMGLIEITRGCCKSLPLMISSSPNPSTHEPRTLYPSPELERERERFDLFL